MKRAPNHSSRLSLWSSSPAIGEQTKTTQFVICMARRVATREPTLVFDPTNGTFVFPLNAILNFALQLRRSGRRSWGSTPSCTSLSVCHHSLHIVSHLDELSCHCFNALISLLLYFRYVLGTLLASGLTIGDGSTAGVSLVEFPRKPIFGDCAA